MCRSAVVLVVSLAFSSAALASQPGQPIDCSDFVAVDPRYRCETYTPFTASWNIWVSREAGIRPSTVTEEC